MFSWLLSSIKLVLVVCAILAVGSWIRWDGRSLSDRIGSATASIPGKAWSVAAPAWEHSKSWVLRQFKEKIGDRATGVVTDNVGSGNSSAARDRDTRAQNEKRQERLAQEQALPADVPRPERHRLRGLIRESNQPE